MNSLLRQANNLLANAWENANKAGDIGRARQISVVWKATEALVEAEEAIAQKANSEGDRSEAA